MNSRLRKVTRQRGQFLSEQAALKRCLATNRERCPAVCCADSPANEFCPGGRPQQNHLI